MFNYILTYWWVVVLVMWLMLIIGGRLNMRPVPVDELKLDVSLLYQLPTNVWFFLDRLANVTIWQLLIIIAGRQDETEWKWETISGRQGRDFPDAWPTVAIDCIAFEIGHCEKYVGV